MRQVVLEGGRLATASRAMGSLKNPSRQTGYYSCLPAQSANATPR